MASRTPKKTKSPKKAETMRAFLSALSSGDPMSLGRVYVFHGEETYLRDFYLSELRKRLVPEDFSAFNYHRLDGASLTVRELSEAAEPMPMMSERSLIVVADYDLSRLSEAERTALCAFLSDVPEWACVVFLYDTVPYRLSRQKDADDADATSPATPSAVRELRKALDAYAQILDFQPLGPSELLNWVAQQFRQRGKSVDIQTAEYLVFTCGSLMDGLLQEIGKIADYVDGATVTRQDIDAIADPVLSRQAFDLSNAVSAGNYDAAASILGDLLKMQTVPYLISGALGKELRRLYTARLALDYGRGQDWLAEIWNMKSPYPAKLALSAARRTSTRWCAWAVRQCERLDARMKSERGVDPVAELKFLLVRLHAGPDSERRASL